MTEEDAKRLKARANAYNECFNRDADLNVTQIMERIGSMEISINNLQNNLMTSIIKFLNEQQEAAADKAELAARTTMIEVHMRAREQTIAGLAWGVAGLCFLAVFALLWYGAHLIGG